MTLQDYISIVQGEADDTSVMGRNVISQAIKEINNEILSQAYKYLIDDTYEDIAATGVRNYTPSPFTQIIGVSYADGGSYNKLREMNYADYIENYLDTTAGTPSRYLAKGSQIILDRPVSLGTLRVFYIPFAPELSSETDTVIIPTRFQNVVKLGASYKYFAFDDNPKAVDYKALYEEALRNMLLELEVKQPVSQSLLYGV